MGLIMGFCSGFRTLKRRKGVVFRALCCPLPIRMKTYVLRFGAACFGFGVWGSAHKVVFAGLGIPPNSLPADISKGATRVHVIRAQVENESYFKRSDTKRMQHWDPPHRIILTRMPTITRIPYFTERS